MNRWDEAMKILAAETSSKTLPGWFDRYCRDCLDTVATQYPLLRRARTDVEILSPDGLLPELATKARAAVEDLHDGLLRTHSSLIARGSAFAILEDFVNDLLLKLAHADSEIREVENGIASFTFGENGSLASSPMWPLVAVVESHQERQKTRPENGAQNFCAYWMVRLWHQATDKLPPLPKDRRGPFVRFADSVTNAMRESDPTVPDLTLYSLKAAIKPS